jgi:PKD repeat protein
MENIRHTILRWVEVLFGLIMILSSCEYETIMDADYPDQQVYFPAAQEGIFVIDNVPVPTLAVPTPGNTYKFTVDLEAKKFSIPLGIYRSGVDNKGSFTVNIAVDTDTVSTLIAVGKLSNVELLPVDKYTVDQTVAVTDGKDFANANLVVDLDFLKMNAPGKRYALGISISSDQRGVNPKLSTVVVVIDTKIMIPTANFTYKVDPDDWKKIIFTNISSYAVSSSWDFGDESYSTENSPSHVYSGEGIYPVKLTIKGVAGDESTKTVDVPVLQIAKIDKLTWTIVDFSSEEPAESNWGPPIQGLVRAAFDDDLSTFWHTAWANEQPDYPHWFIIDMGKTVTIASFECFRRQGDNRGPTEVQFMTSLDGITWVDQGTYPFNPDTDSGQIFTMSSYPKARYFKFIATKGRSHFAFLAEINVYGSVID